MDIHGQVDAGFDKVADAKMQNNLTGDPRTRGLIRASYEAVGAPIAVV